MAALQQGSGMGRALRIGSAILAIALLAPAATAADDKVPYWASISAREAIMRAGPGSNFPAVWKYVRAGLPVKVVARHQHWRKVQEPDGTVGWMNGILLSEDRTAIVIGDVTTMRDAPDTSAKVLWRVEPGVVGRISHCTSGWCEFDVLGRAGYIATASLWGVEAGETVD
jgi:SH3-like domain-containing protein